jgi:hypothetical protein
MRIRMFSPFLLLIGLTLGLLAMWASASPLGATGDLVTGGWTACSVWMGEEWSPYFGVPSNGNCDQCGANKCDGTSSTNCSNYGGAGSCWGGTITIITCNSQGERTRAGGATACTCYDYAWFYVMNSTCY